MLLEGAVYRNGALMPLGPTGYPAAYAASINSSGVVVGETRTGAYSQYGDPTLSVRWTDGVASLVPVSGGWNSLNHIADDGTMLGRRFVRENGASVWKPFVIRNGVETVLPLATSYLPSGSAVSVNASGTIVGASSTNNGPYDYRAAMWRNGTVQDLGTSSPNLTFSSAQKVLNDGRVWVRSSTNPYGGNAISEDAFWENGTWTSLANLGGYQTSVIDVNNSGLVLGQTKGQFSNERRTFLYDAVGGFRFIDTIFEGTPYATTLYTGHNAVALNDAGQMLFGGSYRDANSNIVVHDLLITPSAVPEPATFAALALGAGVLLRRRSRR